jgi:hypothetical protein
MIKRLTTVILIFGLAFLSNACQKKVMVFDDLSLEGANRAIQILKSNQIQASQGKIIKPGYYGQKEATAHQIFVNSEDAQQAMKILAAHRAELSNPLENQK